MSSGNGSVSKLTAVAFGFAGGLGGIILGVMIDEFRSIGKQSAKDRERLATLETHMDEINKLRNQLELYRMQELIDKERGVYDPRKDGRN